MSTTETLTCPACGHGITRYRNPVPTVDIIIEYASGIVLIQRKNPPYGWALPGGFVDYGETVEHAAMREAAEETGLELNAMRLFNVYSDPMRDPRQHTISIVFTAEGSGELIAGDDAKGAAVFSEGRFPEDIAFDHSRIISDYYILKNGKNEGMVRQ